MDKDDATKLKLLVDEFDSIERKKSLINDTISRMDNLTNVVSYGSEDDTNRVYMVESYLSKECMDNLKTNIIAELYNEIIRLNETQKNMQIN